MSGEQRQEVDCGGVMLAVASDVPMRAGRARPVVLLHGFTGSSESMAGVARSLCEERPVHRIDLIGHGRSDAPEDVAHYSMQRCVDQVVALMDALGLERPHLVGYSMGARTALSLAAARPDRIASALLVGVSPGFDDAEARTQRVRADSALADQIESGDLAAFVDRWMALPLFASQKRLGEDALAAAREQRLRCSPRGLANSLLGMGTGAMPPLCGALATIPLPVRLVVGDEDVKFLRIAQGLVATLRDGALDVIPQAGHAAHLEQPEAFARIARDFHTAVDARLDAAASLEEDR